MKTPNFLWIILRFLNWSEMFWRATELFWPHLFPTLLQKVIAGNGLLNESIFVSMNTFVGYLKYSSQTLNICQKQPTIKTRLKTIALTSLSLILYIFPSTASNSKLCHRLYSIILKLVSQPQCYTLGCFVIIDFIFIEQNKSNLINPSNSY